MTDSVAFAIVLGAISGFVLGLGFFGALAWTAQRLVRTSRPATLMMASLVTRMALLALGLVALARLSPWALGAAVPALITARLVLVRRFAAPSAGTVSGARAATGSTPGSGRGEPDDG